MKRLTFVAVCALSLMLSSVRAYDLPFLNLGFTSFLDGAPPAGPGFYFQNYFMYYHADKFANADGNSFPTAPKVDIVANLFQGLYVSNQKVFLGGKWGMDLIVPVANFSLDSKIPGLSANNFGIGDILIGPFLQWDPIMGKNGPIFMHRFEFQMLLPTGNYDRNEAINQGSNVFSINPYWAATLFLTPKWTTSWRIHYLWNDENTEPNEPGCSKVQAGQAIHLNFATEYEVIEKRLRLGINGYYLKQITDTKVDGNNSPNRREEVIGIGPGLLYSFSQNDHIFFNFYQELGAVNRTEGQRFIFRWTHHF
ncbi:MAG: phenol degradation protein meta [Verrucomicrobia bacterium]|nr:phenol degradation protein meta [Verrucomicrobiota bacterium]